MSMQSDNVQVDAAAIGGTAMEIDNQTKQLTVDVTAIQSHIDSIRSHGVDTSGIQEAVKRLINTKLALEAAADSLSSISRPVAPETAPPQNDTKRVTAPEEETDAGRQIAVKRAPQEQKHGSSKQN